MIFRERVEIAEWGKNVPPLSLLSCEWWVLVIYLWYLIAISSIINSFFSSFHHYLFYLKLFSSTPKFPYIWDVNEVIHISYDDAYGNEFIFVGKNMMTKELYIFYHWKCIWFGIWLFCDQMRKILIFQLVF